MISRRWTLVLFVLLTLVTAGCARGSRPVATDDERPRASHAGTQVLGERIERAAGSQARVPLVVEQPTPTPVLPVVQPEVVQGPSLSTFPFAPSPAMPSIQDAHVTCGVDGLELWVDADAATTVSDAGAVNGLVDVEVSLRLNDGAVSLLFVAQNIFESESAALVDDWGTFPGSPNGRQDLLTEVCVASAWPLTIEVQDAAGNDLRAALVVAVDDDGWLETHAAEMGPIQPPVEVAQLSTPWTDPATGFGVEHVILMCVDGIPQVQLVAGSPVVAELTSQQWVALAADRSMALETPNAADWFGDRAHIEPFRPSSFEVWSGKQAASPACQASTWPVWVRLFDGELGVFEAIFDAPVLGEGR